MALGRICSRAGGAICLSCGKSCRLDNRRRTKKTIDRGVKLASYQRLRLAALKRDRHRCQFRLPGCTGKATTVHLRKALGGDHSLATLDDLTSGCAHCHGVVDGGRGR